MEAKARYRQTLLKYLGNPDNDFPSRRVLTQEVLGLKHSQQIYRYFTVDELADIEREALEIRRRRYASDLARVDKGVLKKAAKGDVQAARLAYQRFEGWSEKQRVEADVTADVAMGIIVTFEGVTPA